MINTRKTVYYLNYLSGLIEPPHMPVFVTLQQSHSELEQQLFTGTVPSADLDILLEALTGIYDLQVNQKDDQLIFTKK